MSGRVIGALSLLMFACSAAHGTGPAREWVAAPVLGQERAPRPSMPAPRMVPVPDACRGAHLAVRGETLEEEAWACACREVHVLFSAEGLPRGVEGGSWCGLRQANEAEQAELSVIPERSSLGAGEEMRVLLRIRNAGAAPATYRMITRHLATDWLAPDGEPLPHAVFSSSRAPDEAMFELAPGGTLEVSLPVRASRVCWVGEGDQATIERRALEPGRYALRVSVGGLAGERTHLVPVEVR